jgi:glyoxylase-like metal-dependent hydrolase (beta-lactamase superfamily II)
MITEVAPDIYRLTVTLSGPMGSVHCYLIAGEEDCVLVDTGPDNHQTVDLVTEAIRESGLDPAADPLGTVVLTHAHPDHAGGVSQLRERFAFEVLAHPFEELFHDRGIDASPFFVSGVTEWLRIHGVPDEHRAEMTRTFEDLIDYEMPAIDGRLDVGADVRVGEYDWAVRWTPGHTPGHVVLHEADAGLLISGDHVLPEETPNVGLNPRQPQNPLADYLDSLTETARIDPQQVFPGHGEPLETLHTRIEEIMAHHDDRLERMRELLAEAPKSAWAIASATDWTPGAFASLNRMGRFSALCETMAHLECLRSNGAVRKQFATGEVRYALTA